MMVKMKKALGSLALVLALAMTVSLLPTIVLASNATAITTSADACYNSENGTVTVAGTINNSTADVTVLAVRSAEKITDAGAYFEGVEEIENKIVYIDQVGPEDTGNYTVNGDSANWNFTFIPKTGVSGGWITVFVGGTDVDQINFVSFSAQVAAPGLTATTWYKGYDLVMNIHKSGDATTPYGDASAIEAWGDAIEEVLVDGSEFEDYTIDSAAATITFEGLSSVSSIKITTKDGEYSVIDITNLNLAPQDRPAGTITTGSSSVVENDDASVEFTVTESTISGWLSAFVNKTADVFVDGVETDDWSYADGVLTINGLTVGSADEKTFKVVVKVENYADSAEVTVKSVSPVKDAYDNLALSVAYINEAVEGAEPQGNLTDEEYYKLWGKAQVTLPSAGANGTEIAWTKDSAAVSGDVILDRPAADSQDKFAEYTFTATITKGDFAPKTKNITVRVNKVGSGSLFEEDAVSFYKKANGAVITNVYGLGADYKVVSVTMNAGDINVETSTLAIDGVELYYSPERSTENTVVFTGIVTAADAAAVVEKAEVLSKAATPIYYGKPNTPTRSGAVQLTAAITALQVINGTYPGGEIPHTVYLTADVNAIGTVALTSAISILQVVNGTEKTTAFKVLQ